MLFERLENRRLLSATPHLSAAAAKPAQPAAGPIVAVESGATLTLTNVKAVQIVDDGAGNVTVYDKSLSGSDPKYALTYDGITTLRVTGTRGDDNISASLATVDATFNGGSGNDFFPVSVNDITDDAGTLLVRATSDVIVNGDDGADVLSGNNYGTGTFVFNGGGGRDSLGKIGSHGYHVTFIQ